MQKSKSWQAVSDSLFPFKATGHICVRCPCPGWQQDGHGLRCRRVGTALEEHKQLRCIRQQCKGGNGWKWKLSCFQQAILYSFLGLEAESWATNKRSSKFLLCHSSFSASPCQRSFIRDW